MLCSHHLDVIMALISSYYAVLLLVLLTPKDFALFSQTCDSTQVLNGVSTDLVVRFPLVLSDTNFEKHLSLCVKRD